MDWFKSGAGQIIAFVGIISTLAGFGWTGATYANKIENLEKKMATVTKTKDAQIEIEERFVEIETSVNFLEKEIDKIEIPDTEQISAEVSGIKVSIDSIRKDLERLEEEVKKENKNPLAG